MELPYYILLLPYAAGCIFFLVWMVFNFYHLIKFGFFDFTGKLNAVVFICFCLVIISFTILLLSDVPWLTTFNLTDAINALLQIASPNAGI